MNNKKIIIGLDGVPYQVIHKFINNGTMPFLKQFVNQGHFLSMNSALPPISSVAWTSFFTGVNPAQHGIFGFYEVGGYPLEMKFNLYNEVKAKPIWEKLSVKGLKTLALNIPNTYPAPQIYGVLISGFVAIDFEKSVYPPTLVSYLKNKKYLLDVDYSNAAEQKDKFIEKLFDSVNTRLEVFLTLLEKEQWGLAIIVFTETDRLHHFFMDVFYDETSKYYKKFVEFYKLIDQCIEKIYNLCEDKVESITIISDHGFEKLETEFNLNYFLEEKGYLKFNSNEKNFGTIDHQSKLYACDPGRIYLNKNNSMTQSEQNEILENLINDLNNIEWNNRKVIKKIYKKNDIFHGEFIANAPDLVILPTKNIDIKGAPNKTSLFGKNVFSGMHTYKNAIFISNDKTTSKINHEKLSIQNVLKNLGIN